MPGDCLPGQYYDAETNLHYNYFRDYDPATGRYIESDPIGLRGGVNLLAYVNQNPISFIDPLGLDSYIYYHPDFSNQANYFRLIKKGSSRIDVEARQIRGFFAKIIRFGAS